MPDKNSHVHTFKITTDSPYSPFQTQVLEEGHNHAIKARPAGEKQLQRLIKKYPRFPQLYNYLSSYYHNIGREDLAIKVNDDIIKKFPDYLHGKINKANQYLTEGKLEEILSIFPPSFNLKLMYPERDSFHISEVFAINNVAVRYFIEAKDYEQAEIHLGILKELDFNDDAAEYLEMLLRTSQLVDRKPTKAEVSVGKELPAPSVEPEPNYHLKEIKNLFIDEEISESTIKGFIKLPRKELIEDLMILLKDATNRFHQHCEKENFYFVINAFILIGKLRAEECLPEILNLLSQNEDVIEFYLDKYLTVMVWEVLYYTGKKHIQDMVEFAINEQNYTYAKTEVVKTLSVIYILDESKRDEIKSAFQAILQHYKQNEAHDTTFIGLMICSIDGCMLCPHFEKEIKQLFDDKKVDITTCGSFEELSSSYNLHIQKSVFNFID